MEYSPFRCPDCKVWWRTATHSCDTVPVKKPGGDMPTNPRPMIQCPKCYKRVAHKDWHTCKPLDSYNKKGETNDWHRPHENPENPPRWNA